ncbi:hypothetical protein [Emticicia agri]|uniref:Uncharacterized protein n=1 Tax=Emticicia agri TaxID=2492393 RepID=A0A4Q5LWE6_9BACT|nr:hypothetical protein [Emticicia agri]RYU93889.1 hypothetical protein EWM59_19815 [Emticicia agri]
MKDSVVIDQWVPYDTTTKSVTMCKIDGRVYFYNTLADKSVFKEELLPDTIETGVKLTYMNPGLSTMGEYYLIDKEGKLRYFGADGTEYSKEVPKF